MLCAAVGAAFIVRRRKKPSRDAPGNSEVEFYEGDAGVDRPSRFYSSLGNFKESVSARRVLWVSK